MVVLSLAVVTCVAAACSPPPGTHFVVDPGGSGEPASTPGVTGTAARPVIIVPGWEIGCEMAPAWRWEPWIAALGHAGVPRDRVVIFDTNRCESNVRLAERLGEWVDELLARTGATEVDLVAHSMGALAARWCIVQGSCAGRVRSVVTLAGANHGTIWAELCPLQFWSAACPDMLPTSSMLTTLNAVDETPDDVRWQAWVSVCELAIIPQTSALLAGAENRYLAECVAHDSWKWYRPAIDAAVRFLQS
jgi:triacylglycerol lipase